MEVKVDGMPVATGLKATAVAGPYKVRAGEHTITVSAGGKTQAQRTVKVAAGSSWDSSPTCPPPKTSGRP